MRNGDDFDREAEGGCDLTLIMRGGGDFVRVVLVYREKGHITLSSAGMLKGAPKHHNFAKTQQLKTIIQQDRHVPVF